MTDAVSNRVFSHRWKRWTLLATAIAAGLVVGFSAEAAEELNLKKEAIGLIKETSLQLLLYSVGVFSIAGSVYAGDKNRAFQSRWLLILCFISLAISLVFGLLTLGGLTFALLNDRLELIQGPTGIFSCVQWISFFFGGAFFMPFVIRNIGK